MPCVSPQVHTGQQTHPFKKAETAIAGLSFNLLPLLQGFGQLLSVHLDPFASQQSQATFGTEKLLDLLPA